MNAKLDMTTDSIVKSYSNKVTENFGRHRESNLEPKGYNSHTMYAAQVPLSYREASSTAFSLENFRGARILCPCSFVPDTT